MEKLIVVVVGPENPKKCGRSWVGRVSGILCFAGMIGRTEREPFSSCGILISYWRKLQQDKTKNALFWKHSHRIE